MRRFLLGWKTMEHACRLSAHIVNYADDFVICCQGQAHKALAAVRSIMDILKLMLNEERLTCAIYRKSGLIFLDTPSGDATNAIVARAYIGYEAIAQRQADGG
jgi:hypothetical protein